MSEFTDLLLQSTDPVTSILLIVLVYYVRQIKEDLQREIRKVRRRVARLENTHIPDRQTPEWMCDQPQSRAYIRGDRDDYPPAPDSDPGTDHESEE